MPLSSGWNLPPGCFERDLPGNRHEDDAWEYWLENIMNDEDEMSEDEMQAAFEKWLEDANEPCTDGWD